MTRFVDLASNKNAVHFQQQLESIMDQKAGLALDARKAQIAQGFFDEATLPIATNAQQIDELSKKTLGSYINKSAREIEDHSIDTYTGGITAKGAAAHRKLRKRKTGIEKAVGKLTK